MKKKILLVACMFAFAAPAAASPETDALRAQLETAESQGLDESILQPIRDLLAHMEAEERELAADAAASGQVLPQSDIQVRPSYFAEIGRKDLEACTAAQEFQLDSICQGAMLRYSDYLSTVNGWTDAAVRDEAWRRHQLTAVTYVQALQDFAD